MSNIGICYIAYGNKAINEFKKSVEILYRLDYRYDIVVISDNYIKGYNTIIHGYFKDFDDYIKASRWTKLNLDRLSPFDYTLYLDVDTRVRQDINDGFLILKDGWEFCLTFSQHQDKEKLWHIGDEDKQFTFDRLQFEDFLQLQAGVFWFKKCHNIYKLFDYWRQEWYRFENQDQGALLRALYKNPVKLWLLGQTWNGGAIINHLFGRVR